MTYSSLKWIALCFMIIDHIGYFFPSLSSYVLLRLIGRMAAPIFFFCFVEGYTHTSNKQKYKKRLFIGAIGMCIINFIMINLFKFIGYPFSKSINILQPNVILTLFIMFLILEGIDKKQYWKLIFIILIPHLEYSLYAFSTIIIFRFIKNKYLKFIVFVFVNAAIALFTKNYLEFFMIFSVNFLVSYNGEKGKFNTKIFYLLYPLNFYFLKLLSIFI